MEVGGKVARLGGGWVGGVEGMVVGVRTGIKGWVRSEGEMRLRQAKIRLLRARIIVLQRRRLRLPRRKDTRASSCMGGVGTALFRRPRGVTQPGEDSLKRVGESGIFNDEVIPHRFYHGADG